MTKHLITPSLLNSWEYYMEYDSDDQSKELEQRDKFLKTLKKEFVSNRFIEFGKEFEEEVFRACDGERVGFSGEVANIVAGGTWQMPCKKQYKNFLLYGHMDVVKGNIIYDIKTASRYELGKFKHSAQHKLYLYCTGLERMKYIVVEVYHGKEGVLLKGLNIEEYTDRDIEPLVDSFIDWLEIDQECKNLYYKNWKCKY